MAAEQEKDFDPLVDEKPSRYVVGIDLGTTNSAVAFIDTKQKEWSLRIFKLPQLVAPGEIESLDTLPSFHYEPAAGENSGNAFKLPWDTGKRKHAVGVYARDHGTQSPDRMIASAKSWLCHAGVDRTANLLPWHGADEVERLSPVEVSARYLRHIHDAWNAKYPKAPLADQEIVLTLPASFDEVARELTLEAASRAGLRRVVLIEEPQAAFYAWIHKHADDWEEQVKPGQKILVCDIGGGTTDFTLIRVRRTESDDAKIQFHRVAVGDHLILGGDNLDLALARHVEQKLAKNTKLAARQWDVLVRSCRRVKEDLLGENAPERATINLPGSGSRLIGGGLQVEVTRDEVQQLLIEGFLPATELDDRPKQRQSGFQEFGLPFAADPAIPRHLAWFLKSHGTAGDDEIGKSRKAEPARPDIVLFNGGFFASPALRERLLEILSSWFQGNAQRKWKPVVLDNDRLDLAVARGAAYYGMVRRGQGVKIAASLARSYYIGVESDTPSAVCLVPGNAEPGEVFKVANRPYRLTVSEPVEFPLFVSSVRLADEPGDLVEIDRDELTDMPPIRTVLRTRSRNEKGSVTVSLNARVTEIGTIDLSCKELDADRSWRLQFDVRSATQSDLDAHETAGETEGFIDESIWSMCRAAIEDVFTDNGEANPEGLVKNLTAALDMPRNDWPMSLLRRIWEALIDLEEGRKRGPAHEARWLNLLGYALRPGYGLAVDDWRVTETWRKVQGKLIHTAPALRSELLILWRRIGGGLSSGQQRSLADSWIASVRALHRQSTTGKKKAGETSLKPNETSEMWHLLGSLELLSVPQKVELGDMILDLLPRGKFSTVRASMIWAIGRLGQRVPVYGPLNTVVSSDVASRWLKLLIDHDIDEPTSALCVMQLSRRTDDRYRDLSDDNRKRAIEWLTDHQAPARRIQLVRRGGTLDSEEQDRVFGEKLPKGLRIH